MAPFVSLVVVNCNGEAILGKCLSSLEKISYPKNQYEIIVVDNASTDKSLDIIKIHKQVRLIKHKRNLGYVGVNSALSKAKGKYLFILNNDLELDPHCVSKLVEVGEKRKDAGVIVPKFINYFSRNIESGGTWISRSFYTGHFQGKDEKEVKETAYLGIEMIRASIARKFGYIYDQDYFIYAEDVDLSLRYRLLGYITLYVPSAIVYHMHSETMKSVPNAKKTYLLERNLLWTFYKVFSWPTIIILSPYVYGMRAFAISKDILSLNFSVAFARMKAICTVLYSLPSLFKKRARLQKLRKITDKRMLDIFTEKHLFSGKRITI